MKPFIFTIRHLIPIVSYMLIWVKHGWTWNSVELILIVIVNSMASATDMAINHELK